MAAEHVEESLPTEFPAEDTAVEEPSLSELKEMLVDIQITVSNILMENKKLTNEMTELKSTVTKQNADITNLKTSLAKCEKKLDEAEKEMAGLRNRLNDQQEEIYELYDLQDRLEQYTRKNSLEIHGVPESAYESPEEVVIKIAEALEVPVHPNDIEIAHKLNRKGNKPIIVKFLSHKVKSTLNKSRAKLRNISVSNLFLNLSAAGRVASDRIFLNENLTSYRRKIINKANEMRRDGVLISVWSMDGKIFVKTSPEGRPIKIDELEDLDYL